MQVYFWDTTSTLNLQTTTRTKIPTWFWRLTSQHAVAGHSWNVLCLYDYYKWDFFVAHLYSTVLCWIRRKSLYRLYTSNIAFFCTASTHPPTRESKVLCNSSSVPTTKFSTPEFSFNVCLYIFLKESCKTHAQLQVQQWRDQTKREWVTHSVWWITGYSSLR